MKTRGSGVATPFLISALDEVRVQLQAPAVLIKWKAAWAPEPVRTLYRRENPVAVAMNQTTTPRSSVISLLRPANLQVSELCSTSGSVKCL